MLTKIFEAFSTASLDSTFDGSANTRIGRIWKVTETGTVGSMTISIPTSVAGGLTFLVVSNTPTFINTAGLASQSALTINGDYYEAAVTFTGTQYFTFITDTPGGSGAPGGIASNLLLWLKADAGVLDTGAGAASDGEAVGTWEDQAAASDATDNNLASPDFRDNSTDNLNGNPVIEFNGTDDGLDLGANNIFSSGTGITWFAVVEPNTTSNPTRIIDYGQYDEAGYGFTYGDDEYGFFTSTSSSGGATSGISHSRGTDPTLVTFQVDFGTDQNISFNGGSALSNQAISLVDLADDKITDAATHGTDDGPFTIGQQSQTTGLNGTYFNGKIAEIAGYSTDLSDADKYRIETYLAIKYGLTLGHNYVADVGGQTTIYNVSTHSSDIVGLGQDDSNQELNQLSSINVNDSVGVTVSDANIDEDEYLVWGNDGGSATLNTTFEGETNVRLGRVWKVTETGSVGSATLSIPTSVATGLTFLIVGNSSTLSSTSDLTGSYELTVNGTNYEANVNFASNSTQYFTFISSAPGGITFPGVVSTDLAVWFKANEGALSGASAASDGDAVNTWEDVSGNIPVKDATDANLSAPPDFRNNATDNINGNSVIEFNGTSDGLDLGSNYIYATGTGMTWFAVLEPNTQTTQTSQRIVDFGEFTAGGYGFSYGSADYGMWTSTTEIVGFGTGASTANQVHSNGVNPKLVTFEIDFNDNQSISLDGNVAATTQAFSLISLASSNIGEAATHGATSGPITIGRQSMTNNLANRYYSGTMAEIVGYTTLLSTIDKNKIESYLALKYGLTLGHNYIADIGGSNTTIYDTTGYPNDITGVGQDNVGQGLNQLSSISENSDALVTATVADGNIDDEEYVIWGNDNAATTLTTTFEGASNTRLDRIWKVVETGSVGMMTISIPTSGLPGLTYLIVGNTSTLANVFDVAIASPLIINGSNYEASINFTSSGTQYFTFTSSNDAGLPVSLTSFTAESQDGVVKLQWITESQINNAGFELWRTTENSDNYDLIASYKDNPNLEGIGTTSGRNEYTFYDSDVEVGKMYYYQLSDVDYLGVRTFHNTVNVFITEKLPIKLKLYANYPNPFNPNTKIKFELPEQSEVNITIYNILGQKVISLKNDVLEVGRYSVVWNGQNEIGSNVASGLYFYVLQTKNLETNKQHRMLKKMILIR